MKYVYIFIVLMFGEYVFAQSGVIAHRGFWKTDGSAQNSIAALLKADSVGCYGSEFDICLTKDNKWVVAHGPAVGGHKIIHLRGTHRFEVGKWRKCSFTGAVFESSKKEDSSEADSGTESV